MRMLSLLLAASLTSPVNAAEPMSPDAFEAYTTGKTLFYGQSGGMYGAEQYLNNRRVRWSFLDGQCQEGRWYPEGNDICFVYENKPDPQCWQFRLGSGGLIAEFQDDSPGPDLYEAHDTGDEMVCLGPEVGV